MFPQNIGNAVGKSLVYALFSFTANGIWHDREATKEEDYNYLIGHGFIAGAAMGYEDFMLARERFSNWNWCIFTTNRYQQNYTPESLVLHGDSIPW